MHKQAALNTAKMIAFGILASTLTLLAIEFLTVETFLKLCGVGIFGYIVYIFYTIEKSRLEMLENLKK